MKIAFDAKRAFHNRRGLGNYSRDTIRLLSTCYPENTFFLFNPSSTNNVNFPLAENMVEILPGSISGRAFPSIWRSYGMCRQLKSVQTDIYHGLSQELPLGINKTGIKSVVTMHDAIFMRFPNLYPRAYRTVFIQKNNYACRVADRIIAISEQTKRDLMEFFDADEQKISVIYQGCNLRFRQPVLTETKLVVKRKYQLPDDFLLTVGAIEKRKNAALIIEALYRFRLKIPLIIIGQTSPYLKELQSMIKKYRMEKQVFFIHSVDPADLPAIYSLAGLFIYPSIFEGFGIPILEALCSGIPVIASTGSCLEESGGPFSRYINPHDADELGEAMTHLLADDLAKKRMIKEGLSFSEQFTDDKIASRLMHVYQSI